MFRRKIIHLALPDQKPNRDGKIMALCGTPRTYLPEEQTVGVPICAFCYTVEARTLHEGMVDQINSAFEKHTKWVEDRLAQSTPKRRKWWQW